MSGSRYNAHTDPLFKKRHIVRLSDFFTLYVYKIYYKLRYVLLPTYVANMFKDFSRNHEHETRQAIIFDEPNVNTSNGENCIRYLLPRIINKTNHTIVIIVDTYSYQDFVNFVKNDMIGHYIENCSISNCYICNHTHFEWLPLTNSEWVSFNIKKINKIKIVKNLCKCHKAKMIMLIWMYRVFFHYSKQLFCLYLIYISIFSFLSDWPDIRFLLLSNFW